MAITDFGFSRTSVLRIDIRKEKPAIEDVSSLPEFITALPRGNNMYEQAQYRWDCLAGQEHPLQIETRQYVLLTICKQSIDMAVASSRNSEYYSIYGRRFNQNEVEFIDSVKLRPEIEWAIDNSFDGLYVARYEDPSLMKAVFRFAVYVKEEQATFWKLKFGTMYGERGTR